MDNVFSDLTMTVRATMYHHVNPETGLLLFYKRDNFHLPTEYRLVRKKHSLTHGCTVYYMERRWGRRRGNPEDRDELIVYDAYAGRDKLIPLLDYMIKRSKAFVHFTGYDAKGLNSDCASHITGIIPDDPQMKKIMFHYVALFEIPMSFPSRIDRTDTFDDMDCYLYRELLYEICDACGSPFPPEIRAKIEAPTTRVVDSRNPSNLTRFLRANWTAPTLMLPTQSEAKAFLDQRLLGMQAVKERLLQILEKMRRSGSPQMNLLLVGAPGIGKTTIVHAFCELLRLPMTRISMAACSDGEAFAGFGSTYKDSKEGAFTSQIFKPYIIENGKQKSVSGIARIVFLSEMDKLNSGNNQNTQSVLLELLDDNRSFYDSYHEFHITLKHCLFIGDANDLSGIQRPLQDRFEVIEVDGYSADEKAEIFTHFSFPSAMEAAHVSPDEVKVTPDAAQAIASSVQEEGVRSLRHIADRIVGHYLTHYGFDGNRCCDTVWYDEEMVRELLPERHTAFLPAQPGSIRSAVFVAEHVAPVIVQCLLEPSDEFRFTLYGSANPLLRQELECAVLCAMSFLPETYHVRLQVYGLPARVDACGQLGLAAFTSVLSMFYDTQMSGVYHGSLTLLGGITDTSSGGDAIAEYAGSTDEGLLYTAMGFTKNLRKKHRCSIVEFTTATVAHALLWNHGHRGWDAV